MDLIFTITDYTTGSPVQTVIDEPVGWDAIKFHLKRDPTFHGFFEFVDDSLGSLQFDGDGYGILKNAYDTDGVGAVVLLSVQYQCSDEGYTTLYNGKFDFTLYKEVNGDRCYVECHVTNDQNLINITSRYDQECDLDLKASFDQLPVSQSVITTAQFLPPGFAPNQIVVGQLLNGLQPGSQITFAGTAHNPGPFTVASSVPNFNNVQESAPTNVPVSTSAGPSDGNLEILNIDPYPGTVTARLTFNALLYGLAAGDILALSGTGSPAPHGFPVDDLNWTVVDVVQSFAYTVITLTVATPVPASPSNNPVAISGAGFVLGGTFNLGTNLPSSTIITIAETITNAESVTATLTAVFLQDNMPTYAGLNKIVTIPPKVIRETSKWAAPITKDFPVVTTLSTGAYDGIIVFTPDWPNVQSEIDETDVGTAVPINQAAPLATPPDTMVFWRQQSLPCQGVGGIFNVGFSGKFADSAGSSSPPWVIQSAPIVGGGTPVTNQFRFVAIKDTQWKGLSNYADGDGHVFVDDTINITSSAASSFVYSKNVTGIQLAEGEYVWFFFFFLTDAIPADPNKPVLVLDNGSYFSFSIDTQCASTPASVYMVNEILSRCAEYYTDGALVVYSDYFGRPDAQPQPSSSAGCGSLEAITNGLKIRGAITANGTSIPKMTTSLKAMFDGLNAIHNIGMRLEADPVRGGSFMRLRIEPIDFFYQNTTVLTISGIKEMSREVDTSMLASTFKCGYNQFETWNNNGLYDMYGTRTYRTQLRLLRNLIDRTCQFLASDYAIEFTRRMWGLTTSDGRYDGNLFVLCLKNKSEQPMQFMPGNGAVFAAYANGGADPPAGWAIGDSVTISHTFGNNITTTIATIQSYTLNTISYHFIGFAATMAVETDQAGEIFNNTRTNAVISDMSFVGATGGILLYQFLFGIQITDTINISNTAANNTNFALNGIFEIPSTGSMVLSTTTSPVAGFEQFAIIADLTNPLYLAEQGMPSGTNVLDPDSVFNYRISPAHNAMRHFKTIAVAYRDYTDAVLIFTNGEGNFYALGELQDGCSPEGAMLSESGNLTPALFANPGTDAKPLYYAELVKFDFPLTYDQFLAIAANPYALISFQAGSGPVESGWIEDLQYSPYEGMGNFILRPKYT